MGKKLVIVESPAKARTINRYLGTDYEVIASVGHVRDLPKKSEKGKKEPVPGVDVENDFEPSYEVIARSKKVITQLKKAAKGADEIWFATDLDREGEAIAWHLAEVLKVDPADAKRVVFNAITKNEIQRAFEHPHELDMNRVNAQQARRILDRIVGYQVSPLLWQRVQPGLSAGRVQSVAVRLIVDREREIEAFIPDERWNCTVRLCADASEQQPLAKAWNAFVATLDEKGKGPTIKSQNGWMSERGAFRAELVEVGGTKFNPWRKPDEYQRDVDAKSDTFLAGIEHAVAATGLLDVQRTTTDAPDGEGPCPHGRHHHGRTRSGGAIPRAIGREEGHDVAALGAIHHVVAAGGGVIGTGLRRIAHHAGGPGALRRNQDRRRRPGRPDHVHANRLDASRRRGDRAGPCVHQGRHERRVPSCEAEHLQVGESGRPGSPRSDPPGARDPHSQFVAGVRRRGSPQAVAG